MSEKLFIIPSTKDDYDLLLAVDRKARYNTNTRYGVMLDYDWNCNTIANAVVETIIGKLGLMIKESGRNGIGINFYDLYSTKVSVKINPKAEKEGNINVLFNPGDIVTNMIENGFTDFSEELERVEPYDEFLKHDQENFEIDELYKDLDKLSRYSLNINFGISISDKKPMAAVAICHMFMMCLFTELGNRVHQKFIEAPEEEKDSVFMESVNFNDNIEIHCEMNDGKMMFNMRPGMNAKLLIKSDEHTENTMGEDF